MKKFDVVEWMAENGHPSYKARIERLKESVEKEIEEIRREAYDRYDDWRTDPLD